VETKYKKFTPLHLALIDDANKDIAIYTQQVELLVQHGADVNAKDVDANTPLHLAAEGMLFGVAPPNIDVIELLVHAGAQWDAKNKQGKTPLQVVQERHQTWSNTPEIKKRLSALSALTR
jgi:ankyrin repeat protein